MIMRRMVKNRFIILMLITSVLAFSVNFPFVLADDAVIYISTAKELQNIKNNPTASYKITNDIDLSGIDFEPIGNEADGIFTGTLDGGNHTIKNLTLEKEGYKYVGLIGCLGGTVKNIKLENVKINAESARYVGAVAGYADEGSEIDNCKTLSGSCTGTFIMIDISLGGIVGYNKGNVQGSDNNIECTKNNGTSYVGGIAGYNELGYVKECVNNGRLIGESTDGKTIYLGGIIGYNNQGYIFACDNTADITSTASVTAWGYGARCTAGGITGYDKGEIIGCNNYGCLSAKASSTYDNSSYGSAPSFTSFSCLGGIVGYGYSNIIKDSNNFGEIIAEDYSHATLGGILGQGGGANIENCINNGDIKAFVIKSGHPCAGGISGQHSGKIIACVNKGIITSSLSLGSSYTYYYKASGAGIIADKSGCLVINCKNQGDVLVKSDAKNGCVYGGGIAAYSNSSDEYYSIYNCVNASDIDLYSPKCIYGGGIRPSNSYVYNCTNSGRVIPTGTDDESNIHIYDASTNINIKDKNISMSVNSTVTVPIELYYYDRELKWTSSDETIATVDSNGKVTGKSPGQTIITAETELGIVTSTTVTVKGYTETAELVSLNKTSVNLRPSDSVQLSASVMPEGANPVIEWTTNNSEIALVDDAGMVTAVAEGTAIITARIGSGRMLYCVVKVVSEGVNKKIDSVYIDREEITLAPQDAYAVNAVINPTDADDYVLTYTSSNDNVAEVNSQGIVTAKSEGVAVIRAEADNGKYDECIVKVISANSPTVVLSSGKALQGDRTTVKASVVRNPGISAYKFTLKYDETKLIPTEINPNSDLGGSFTTNLDDTDRNELNVLWYSDSDVDINSDLFSVEFKILEEAQLGDEIPIELSCTASDICNSNGDKFAFNTIKGYVKVSEPLPGDVCEDEEVNVYDITILSRYVTGLESLTSRQLQAGDVNKDSEVDIKDVVKLAQYLVGWSGVVLMSVDDENNEKTADIKFGTAAVNDENETYIPVSIENNSGIAGFRFNIEYDHDAVEILDVIPNTEILPENLQTNLGQEDENGLLITWYQEGNTTANGELFKLKVKYMGDTMSEIKVKQEDNNMCDQTLANVKGIYHNGYVLKSKCMVGENVDGNSDILSIYSDISLQNQPAAAVIGLYKSDGTLVKCMSDNINFNGTKQDIAFNISDLDYNYIKIYLWDGLDSMKPIDYAPVSQGV